MDPAGGVVLRTDAGRKLERTGGQIVAVRDTGIDRFLRQTRSAFGRGDEILLQQTVVILTRDLLADPRRGRVALGLRRESEVGCRQFAVSARGRRADADR